MPMPVFCFRAGLIKINMNRKWFIILGFVIIAGGIFIFMSSFRFTSLELHQKIEMLKCAVQKTGGWAPAVYLLSYIVRPVLFIPATPVVILGGILFGSVWGVIYGMSGLMCSGVIEFIIFRYFFQKRMIPFLREKTQAIDFYPDIRKPAGEPAGFHSQKRHGIISHVFMRFIRTAGSQKFLREYSNEMFGEKGFITVFLIRFIPNVAFDIQNCGLAFSPVRFRHYLFGTFLGCFPACVFYVYVGSFAFHRPGLAGLPGAFAGGVIILCYLLFFHKKKTT